MKAIQLTITMRIDDDGQCIDAKGDIAVMPTGFKPNVEQLNQLQKSSNKMLNSAKEMFTNGSEQVPNDSNN